MRAHASRIIFHGGEEASFWSVLWHLLIGAVIGIIARLIHPGKENMAWLMTILIGALSAFIGGGVGRWTGLYDSFWIGLIVAIVVTVIAIAIYARIKGKKWAPTCLIRLSRTGALDQAPSIKKDLRIVESCVSCL